MRNTLSLLLLLQVSGAAFSFLAAQTEYKVYPGDTNHDAVVNVRDLLPIGIAFQKQVNARADMGIDWNGKLAIDSLELFLPNTGVNFVHINSNGDHRIDEQDLDAVVLNYDSTFTDELPPAWGPEPFAPVSYCPELKVYFDRDTAFLLDTFFAEIWLEFPVLQPLPEPEGILGISFSFQYPIDNINDQLTRILPDPEASDLLFVAANAQGVSAVKSLPPGRGDVAVAGRGVNALIARRLICKVGIVVEDMIFRSPMTERPFWIDILPESVLMVNRREERFKFCLQPPDTIVLSDRPTAVQEVVKDAAVRLWPNPNSGSFQVELPAAARGIRVYHADGRLQWSERAPHSTQVSMRLPDLPAGLYFLLVETTDGIFRKRFVVN